MGAGQIGGIATMLDFDFNNAAGFLGKPTNNLQGQYIVYYLSHAMLFCTGVLIEPHVVLTPADCIYSERFKFQVYGGSHQFLEGKGTTRTVENICMHRAYNHSAGHCSTDNIALLVLAQPYIFRFREPNADFILNRVRYGLTYDMLVTANEDKDREIKCFYHGWGSRRNGFLLPLLLQMRRIEVKILDSGKCDVIWDTENKFLCLNHVTCTNEKYGALCPDDVGSVVECGGYVQGMMVSRLVDRPCGVGFLNLALYSKFIECAVDDSRDAMEDTYMTIPSTVSTPTVTQVTVEDAETTPCVENCAPELTLPTPTTPDLNEVPAKRHRV